MSLLIISENVEKISQVQVHYIINLRERVTRIELTLVTHYAVTNSGNLINPSTRVAPELTNNAAANIASTVVSVTCH